jgi:simple sugar transport system ATP-binding protein
MSSIYKKYGENMVLKNVNFSIKQGEIRALIGENGAGKSTIMNILFGMPVIHETGGFEGEILINDIVTKIESPRHAMELGIGMVHQEFMLIPGFSATENIKLNRETVKKSWYSQLLKRIFGKRLMFLDIEQMDKDAKNALKRVNLTIDPDAFVGSLPVGYKQFLEIAREIDKKNVKLIVFDEPTAVLTESEAEMLLKIMRKLASDGVAIIFITHRLDEVIKVCDNVTILRDGEHVADKSVKDTNVAELAELMVGRKVEKITRNKENNPCIRYDNILELKNFGVDMPGEQTAGINLKVRKGEILGIGGLGGQGKTSIPNGILGIYPTHGEIVFKGEVIEKPDPLAAIINGCAFVSENRRESGLLLDSSIETNIVITAMHTQHQFLTKRVFFTQADKNKIRQHALRMINELDIRCISPLQHARRLSGGNQQKVCIARALTLSPDLLLISEPTRGIDIGAKRLVLEYIVQLNQNQGVTVIIVSSELTELRSVSDRVAIITNGKIEAILSPDDTDTNFGLAMAGLLSNPLKGKHKNER